MEEDEQRVDKVTPMPTGISRVHKSVEREEWIRWPYADGLA